MFPASGRTGGKEPSMKAKTQKTRIERDSMGEIEVPADALWGASTQRAILNFPANLERIRTAGCCAFEATNPVVSKTRPIVIRNESCDLPRSRNLPRLNSDLSRSRGDRWVRSIAAAWRPLPPPGLPCSSK